MTADGTVVLLGTAGGPTPKRGRHGPAHAVVAGGHVYVIDCGTGVASQLVDAGLSLSQLRAVFVTHHHADHNADLGNLLLLGWTALRRPVAVHGPPPLADILDRFLAMQAYDIALRMQDDGRPDLAALIAVEELRQGGIVYEDEHVRVTAALVEHPPVERAFAYRVDTADRSVVFSGDTARCAAVAELAAGADVLVHEAVYHEGLPARLPGADPAALLERVRRSHTSAQEAGEVAEAAGVGTLVLSPLLPVDPSVTDDRWTSAAATTFSGDVIVGKDLLVV